MENSKKWLKPAITKPTILECFASGIDVLPREQREKVIRRLLSQRLLLPTVREIVLSTDIATNDWCEQKSWDLFHTLCDMILDRRSIGAIVESMNALSTDTSQFTVVPRSKEMWDAFEESVRIVGEGFKAFSRVYPRGACDNLTVSHRRRLFD